MYKIMIVDDEPLAQSSLVNYVHREYPELEIVSVCGNGNEAYEEFIHNPADILLTDIRMPVMDGLDLIQKLQEESYVFVPIIISGYNDFTYEKTAMRMG
jgi:two-component system response regulator YesN|nr:response regulator [uncultured Lachnoclostridium sp.]